MDTDRQSSTCRGASCSFSLVDHDTVDDALEHMRFHERTLKQHARECSAQRKPYLVNQLQSQVPVESGLVCAHIGRA